MCGISGIYGASFDKESSKQQLFGMISCLRHRGPDSWGYYASGDIMLGQTRLSIVDLASGDQPMQIDDHIMIYNGEIYNYIELREELKANGIKFNTTSDTEVLLRMFIQYGTKCFEKLNGQFAFLIWNRKTKELTIARDRFGIRPLYFMEHNKLFYFGSEMKVFDRIPGFERSYNLQQLFVHGLLWNTCGSNTVYNKINTLPGGSYAVFTNGKLARTERFYELGRSFEERPLNFREVEEEFKALLDDAVKLRLRSDVPVGAYLSGGIDSSVILSLIGKHTSKSYKTFSITFEDREYDESFYQNEMIQRINTDHHTVNITYEKLDEAFPEAIYHTERPVFRTAPTPLFLLSDVVNKNNIKVVLTGEGADEILWGYDSFKEVRLLEFWNKFPDSKLRPLLIKKLYPHLNHYKDEQQYGMMRMFYEGFLNQMDNDLASGNIRIHNNKILKNYFDKSHNIEFNKNELLTQYNLDSPKNLSKWNTIQKNQFLEMKTLLAGYLLSSQGDRMSMAHSVEGRYPFLDHRVVDFLFNVKNDFKLNGFNQKYLLKKGFADEIPDSIINRPKRPYMSPDLKSFFRNGKLTENASFFLDEKLIKDYQVFNPKWVQRFLMKFWNSTPENVGYRDNMIITFILSTQIALYWAKNPRHYTLSDNLLKVAINDY